MVLLLLSLRGALCRRLTSIGLGLLAYVVGLLVQFDACFLLVLVLYTLSVLCSRNSRISNIRSFYYI
jgi:thiol:disulfide interchange protein